MAGAVKWNYSKLPQNPAAYRVAEQFLFADEIKTPVDRGNQYRRVVERHMIGYQKQGTEGRYPLQPRYFQPAESVKTEPAN